MPVRAGSLLCLLRAGCGGGTLQASPPHAPHQAPRTVLLAPRTRWLSASARASTLLSLRTARQARARCVAWQGGCQLWHGQAPGSCNCHNCVGYTHGTQGRLASQPALAAALCVHRAQTYTMGTSPAKGNAAGIVPRLIKSLFSYVEAAKAAYDIELKVRARAAAAAAGCRRARSQASNKGAAQPSLCMRLWSVLLCRAHPRSDACDCLHPRRCNTLSCTMSNSMTWSGPRLRRWRSGSCPRER